ncbi:EpsG family protein [Vibrio hyugaensis]|nr:EpsG family protein [Vibrio hyugaensis]
MYAVLMPFIIITYSLISGFRNVGADTETYISIYGNVDQFSMYMLPLQVVTYVEVGYNNIMYLFKHFGASFEIFSTAMTLFFLIGVFHSYKSITNNYYVAAMSLIFFLFTFTCYQLTFNQVRQGVSIVFVLFATNSLYVNDHKKYLSWVLVSSLFHSSALMFLALPVFRSFIESMSTKTRWTIIALMPVMMNIGFGKEIVSAIITVSNGVIDLGNVGDRVSRYSDSDLFGRQSEFGLITILSLLGLCVLNMYSEVNDKSTRFFTSLVTFGYFVFSITFDFVVISQRILYVFDIIMVCLLVNTLVNHDKDNEKFLLSAVIFIALSLKVVVTRA